MTANVQVNNIAGGGPEASIQGETTIVEFDYDDPADSPDEGSKDVILIAWNDAQPSFGVGIGRSEGGAAFQHDAMPSGGRVGMPAGFRAAGDPVLAVDYHAGLDAALGNPRVWLAHMGVPQPSIGGGSNGRTILVSFSDDGGRTFPGGQGFAASNPGVLRDDKPWLAVDQRGGARPPDGNIYACWTRLNVNAAPVTTQILMAQSTDGVSFGPEIPVTPLRTMPAFVQGCQVVVDIDGHVYVAWVEFLNNATNTPFLMLRHAAPPAAAAPIVLDAPVQVQQLRGASAGVPGGVVGCAAPNWLPVAPRGNFTYNFVLNFPSLATNPYNGDLYLAWSMWNGPFGADGPSRFDVFYRRGQRPGGRVNWSRRLRVNDDGATRTDQFMPAIATYPLPVFPVPLVADVGVAIQWYDKRGSGTANNAFELFSAERPFTSNALISDAGVETINPPNGLNDCRVADYNGLTSGVLEAGAPDGADPGTYFLHSWSDTRNNAGSDPEVFFQTQDFNPGSLVEIPPVFTDLKLILFFTQFLDFEVEVGLPLPVLFEALIQNAGPAAATTDTWLTVSAPPEVSTRWLAGQTDACYGPAPSPETYRGPYTPTLGVDCSSEGPITVISSETVLLSGEQLNLQRELEFTCLAEGVFQVELFAGTGPVLPHEVEDADINDNGLTTSVNIDCLPDPAPPAPQGLKWTSATEAIWNDAGQTMSYTLYRGSGESLMQLTDGRYDSCLRLTAATPTSGNTLAEIPASGSLYWYLVTANDGLGHESASGPGRVLDSLGDCSDCSHLPCATGVPLSNVCADSCIAQICQQDSFCCNNGWDAQCVQEVRTLCGRLECAESAGSCGHPLCTMGAALFTDCDAPPLVNSCVASICNDDPYCCDTNGAWDGPCVSRIPLTCAQTCE